jgi:tRNA-dihydrouridine synthase
MFTGKANWDEIARVVEALDIPVIGNGDITSAADIQRMHHHTRCAAVMVGRGSFGNPWIFRDGHALLRGLPVPLAPTANERFAVALEHAQLALRLQGDSRHTVMEFRKHLGWYTKGLPDSAHLRQRLFLVQSMAEAEALFADYLEPAVHAA